MAYRTRRRFPALPLILLPLLLSFSIQPAPAAGRLGPAKYTIKAATLAPEGSSWMRTFHEMNTEVYDKTGGQVKFKIYPGGVLGSEDDVLRKIRIGQLHGSTFTGSGLTAIYSDFRVLNLPLMFDSHEEFDHVMARLRPRLEAEYLKKGYVVLGWPELGFTYCYSKKAVAGVSELKKTKPWMWGNDPIMSAIYHSAGVNPVNVDVGDVFTGLQTGLLDTAFNTPLGVIALQWFTRLETMTDMPLTFSVGALLVTTKKFDSLPGDLQQVVREVAAKHTRQLTLKTREDNEESIRVLEKEGIRIIPLSDEGRKEFEQLSRDVAESLRGKDFSPEMHDLVRGYVTEYRNNRGGE